MEEVNEGIHFLRKIKINLTIDVNKKTYQTGIHSEVAGMRRVKALVEQTHYCTSTATDQEAGKVRCCCPEQK